jgi:diaminopimelate decarboxylase
MTNTPPLQYINNELIFDGIILKEIIEKLKTPCYLYSEKRIRENFRRALSVFRSFNDKFRFLYAIKANSNINIARILMEEGAQVDCSSATEIKLAKEVGFDLEKSMFTGEFCTDEDLDIAETEGIVINLDNKSMLNQINKTEIISVRVNLDISAGAFEQIQTGKKDDKFGLGKEDAISVYKEAKARGIDRFGMHIMAGSCEMDPEKFKEIVEKTMDFAAIVANDVEIDFEFVNFGGGLGIPYYEESSEKELDINLVAKLMMETFAQKCEEHNLGDVIPMMEPGRYFVGDAGIVVAKVTQIKVNETNDKEHKIVGLDASMATMLRPAIYGAHHRIMPITDRKEKEIVDIVGCVCESTDAFAKKREMAVVHEGDYIIIADSGAYGFVMASDYNGRLVPPEYMITEDGALMLIRRQTSFEELIAKQEPKKI